MDPTSNTDEELKPLKIEQTLPVTVTGIESVKESYSDSMSPHRKMYKWFARRPTAVTRLAILSSVLPSDVENETLLEYMCVGPERGADGSIEDYVLEKASTKEDREGNIEEHFGYEYPHRRLPSEDRLEDIHTRIREQWGGEIPTVLDPTAGGGTIPFESSRFGFPSISNELNPVGWLLNEVILDYARSQGSLETEVKRWADQIQETVEEELREYFPRYNGVETNYYFRTYSTECPSCGQRFPLSNRWWFNRSKRIAVVPQYGENTITYDCKELPKDSDFDASEGTVSDGDAECPHCGVVTEREDLIEKFQQGDFEYELCAVKYPEKINGTQYHPPTEEDYEAIERAEERINSDLDLSTLLQEKRYLGYYDRAGPYGITQWRDLFSPRQLLAHATYLDAFQEVKEEIQVQYESEESNAILTLLSLIGTRLVDHNSRLVPIHARFGYVADMLGNNNFTFQWHFGETNPLAGGKSYERWKNHVLENYEEVVSYYGDEPGDVDVLNGNAADLPYGDESIEAIVIDPPYGDNIIYSEVADALYVWLRKYLQDIFPEEFTGTQTNKRDEAVENPSLVGSESGEDTARERYEQKMKEIFSEAHRVLDLGGVITIYFTDKEIGAWDSLTTSLMDAGFTITATHAISSEAPERIGVKGQSSADTSLLLTCRKPLSSDEQSEAMPTLWSDIRQETRKEATKKATELLDSSVALTKTDIIISAFGPTLRVFTENYPVVDKHDNVVRPKRALEEARAAVTEVLVERELDSTLDAVDPLSKWYILCWLVYDRPTIPYDEARQLGLGVGADIDELKSETKVWGKSGEQIELKGQEYRVRDFIVLEQGEKRRKRAYPVDPRDTSFTRAIDAVHATLNVLDTKGSEFTWNWVNDRELQNQIEFTQTIRGLIQVISEEHEDYDLLMNLISGETGELLDIDVKKMTIDSTNNPDRTTLNDF
jgi:putative DNA methylase